MIMKLIKNTDLIVISRKMTREGSTMVCDFMRDKTELYSLSQWNKKKLFFKLYPNYGDVSNEMYVKIVVDVQ